MLGMVGIEGVQAGDGVAVTDIRVAQVGTQKTTATDARYGPPLESAVENGMRIGIDWKPTLKTLLWSSWDFSKRNLSRMCLRLHLKTWVQTSSRRSVGGTVMANFEVIVT